MKKPFLFPLIFLLTILFTQGISAQAPPDGKKPEAPFSYVRIYADDGGHSHFSDETIVFSLRDYAPPLAPISVSQKMNAENVVFISNPPGWSGDWHPAPRRQFIFVLTGEYELEVSDGEKRRFGPGTVMLVEDLSGKGHRTRNAGTHQGCVAAVPVPEAK